jgi:hypothetical protein
LFFLGLRPKSLCPAGRVSDFVGFDGLLFWGFAPSPFCPIGRILLFPAAEKVNKKAAAEEKIAKNAFRFAKIF